MLKLALIFMVVGIPLAWIGNRINIWGVKRLGGFIAALGILMFALWATYWVYNAYFRYG